MCEGKPVKKVPTGGPRAGGGGSGRTGAAGAEEGRAPQQVQVAGRRRVRAGPEAPAGQGEEGAGRKTPRLTS